METSSSSSHSTLVVSHNELLAKQSQRKVTETQPLLKVTTPPEEEARQTRFLPKSVCYIISTQFCERFTFYGIKAILLLYLTNYLFFDNDSATAVVHLFSVFASSFPLLGGFLSDSYLGKFKTILYLSTVYLLGNFTMALTAIPGVTGDPPQPWGLFLGLALLAIGTGGISPCVSAFGGDQFKENQSSQIGFYFSLFYFSINLGSVLSMILTPVLRNDVHCFGRQDCFSIAFGIPAMLMIVAMAIFFGGRSSYIIKPPSGENLVVKTAKCIGSALKRRFRATSLQRRQVGHWLDFAPEKYERQFVSDVKSVLAVVTMFIPLPIFWSLYDQQGSRWTSQATLMDGRVSFFGYNFEIKPDQMQVCNAVLILVFIPFFEKWVYPAVNRTGCRFRPLQRMAVGMLFVAFAFCLSGIVQSRIENQGVFQSNQVGIRTCVGGCVSLLWQIPQYVVITIAEVIFSVTGLEFTYSQAPASMKSVCQACWSLTIAMGNVVVIFVAESKMFSPSIEPFFFAFLAILSLLLFMLLSLTFTYKEDRSDYEVTFCGDN